MVVSAYMSAATVTPHSYINSDTTIYDFSLTATVPLTSSNYVLIKFPSDITLPSKSTTLDCYTTTSAILKTVSCSLTSKVSNGVLV
jgi:hypothetical protein